MKPHWFALFASYVVGLLMLAGCGQGPEVRKPAAQKAVVPAPVAPASAAADGAGSELSTVLGAVTKIDNATGLIELQTPSGWSQFILTEPERRRELERVTVGERVDVKVDVRTSERKVIAVLSPTPSVTTRAESK
jgi:hypothetical protein